MKSNLLTTHHTTFADIFLDNIFKEIHIHNDIKKLIEVLLIQITYMGIL